MSFGPDIDALISDDALVKTLRMLIDTPSPTGEEAALADVVVDRLNSYDISASNQTFNETQANAIGEIKGNGEKNLLLYAPLDTVTSNREKEDLPWLGPEMRPDMSAKSYVENNHIYGLGAHNPKGHAACIIEAARVLKALGKPLNGNIFLGFGAGGMPTHSRDGFPAGTGHGVGCRHMIAALPKIDGAIIAKSGTSVTWQEVGFIWLEVTVAGKHNYVGARHLMPYDNAIANTARLVLKLEDWFEDYAARHATDLCRPQGVISHMESGWKRMPAFTPECARFLIDLRFSPEQKADAVEIEFADVLSKMSEELGVQTQFKRVQTINASHTSPDDPIIKSAIRVWEEMNDRPHEPFTVMSGATDANILRGGGIPTARIGMAKSKLPDIDFALGMNSVAVSELRRLTKFLVLSALHYFGDQSHG